MQGIGKGWGKHPIRGGIAFDRVGKILYHEGGLRAPLLGGPDSRSGFRFPRSLDPLPPLSLADASHA